MKTAVGQLIARLRHGMEEQPLRGFMVGLAVSVDRLFLVWGQRDGSQMLFYHLPQQAFALREDSPGLQLFLKVVTAPAETAGFPRLPPGLIDIPCATTHYADVLSRLGMHQTAARLRKGSGLICCGAQSCAAQSCEVDVCIDCSERKYGA